ncbi:glycosyltransferase family 39 protein [Halobacillus salinarum]|uniref:Glycosyltransferase family 39 protein n=1 Tax=Halobacillus salinarum TaxID=2932257 RepID=A0ABY4ENU2_9BACI|nr:glycosyltransferase family 39 protein [Halobacillus salinarum]UOQ45823.1 glycosyltransferase family 39 protein [Halobacillus salinarum]
MINRFKSRLDVPLFFIVLLSLFLNGYKIWTDEYANTYYTTAVGSMMQSFHNFFFGSLDSAGSVTVDKPPVTFWIQTISAKIFGLEGWSVILPQALAGVGSVILLYILVKPNFGKMAARLAALGMAVTPVAVAVSRTNNIDSMLVFTLLLATLLLFKGVRSGSKWSIMAAFAVIGIGFNMKMLQAYMVLPAFYLFYLLGAKVDWKKKLGILTGATTVLIVISLSWALIVDLIPDDQRPYIGSSDTNSVLELAFGYNGLSRLTGQQGPGGGGDGQGQPPGDNGTTNDMQQLPNEQPDFQQGNGKGTAGNAGFGPPDMENGQQMGGQRNGPGGAGGMFGTGEKGPLRLFKSALSGQASWLIPFAAFASLSLLAGFSFRNRTAKQTEIIFWLAWLIPGMVFFSVAGFFHHYYLIMLAPPIAALFGTGAVKLYQDYRTNEGWKSWLLPAAVCITAIFQWYIIHPYDDVIGNGWSIGVAVLGIGVSLWLVFSKDRQPQIKTYISAAALTALLIGPLYWAATPIVYGGNSMIPQAGPTGGEMGGFGARNAQAQSDQDFAQGDASAKQPPTGQGQNNSVSRSANMGGGPGGMNGSQLDEQTLTYLTENNSGETYLFATTSYQTAAPYIIDEQESVITMGGFSGSDPVYSVEELKKLVTTGQLKYFLISERGMRGGGSSEVTQWIKENGKEIPDDEWQSNSADNGSEDSMRSGFGGGSSLYEVSIDE